MLVRVFDGQGIETSAYITREADRWHGVDNESVENMV